MLESLVASKGRIAARRLAVAGALVVAAAEATLALAEEAHQPFLEGCYAVWLLVLPALSVLMQARWEEVHRQLDNVVSFAIPTDRWLRRWHRCIFEAHPVKMVGVALFWSIGMLSMYSYRAPYRGPLANGVALAVFGIVLFTAALFAWMVVAYAASLFDLARRASARKLFATDSSQFRASEGFWFQVSVFTSIGFALILAATTLSSYAAESGAMPWMWVASTAPAIAVVVGFFLFHLIRARLTGLQTDALLEAIARHWGISAASLKEVSADGSQQGVLLELLSQTKTSAQVPTILASVYTLLVALLPIAIQAYSAFQPQAGAAAP